MVALPHATCRDVSFPKEYMYMAIQIVNIFDEIHVIITIPVKNAIFNKKQILHVLRCPQNMAH